MADHWLMINSTKLDSYSEEDVEHTLPEALDGTDYWREDNYGWHWFILDLKKTYIIKKVRGRSNLIGDPMGIAIYVSDINEGFDLPIPDGWGTAVFGSIISPCGQPGWKNNIEWVETDTVDKRGRYMLVFILITEIDAPGPLYFGDDPAFTIFDVYGDVVPANPPIGKPLISPDMVRKAKIR